MALALRITDDNLIWKDSPDETPWLEDGDIPADRISDLRTEENQLSIWMLKEDKSELSRCLSAFAANRMRLTKLDYMIFNVDLLSELNLDYIESKSNLRDKEINILHRDIINLSAKKLFSLAQVLTSKCELGRKEKQDVASLLIESIDKGWIRKESLQPSLLLEVEKISEKMAK